MFLSISNTVICFILAFLSYIHLQAEMVAILNFSAIFYEKN